VETSKDQAGSREAITGATPERCDALLQSRQAIDQWIDAAAAAVMRTSDTRDARAYTLTRLQRELEYRFGCCWGVCNTPMASESEG
jgi:hypothetical protein